MFRIYLASAIESGVFLVVYVILASILLYKAKCSLPCDAYITMFIFFACTILNLVFYTLELFVDRDLAIRSLIEIPTIVASGLITGVLYWYTYQMKIVLLKTNGGKYDYYMKQLDV